jgi:protein-L-isoaspartate O-methyltransferase
MAFDIRHQYVLSRQIAAYGNFSPFIMECFEKTPRGFFLPPSLTHKAYVEDFIPLSKDRAVMAPLFLARLMKHLPVVREKNIMVVGGGTGYGAALLSYYASSVFLLESDDHFSVCAQAGLSALHIDNVVACQGNLKEGLSRQGPFHFIIIEGGVDHIPSCFFDQLTADGVGVFACQASGLPVGHMTRFWRNKQGVVSKERFFEMPCYPLREFCQTKKFEF